MAPAPLPAGHSVELKARVELVRMAYREPASGTWASAGAAVALALAMTGNVSPAILWPWLGWVLAAAAYRWWLAVLFERLQPPPEKVAAWGLHYITGAPESDLDLALDVTLSIYAGYVSAEEKGREVEVPRL